MSRTIPNAAEMGKKGGRKRFEQIGSQGFAELGAKGRETIRKNDPDFYKRLSLAGAVARKERHNKEKKVINSYFKKWCILCRQDFKKMNENINRFTRKYHTIRSLTYIAEGGRKNHLIKYHRDKITLNESGLLIRDEVVSSIDKFTDLLTGQG